MSPESSLTGQTSKTSQSSTLAWQIPLKHNTVPALLPSGGVGDTSLPRHPKADALSPHEIAQEKCIQLLEAQLASLSAGNSRTSGEKSQCSGDSPNSLATVHAQLDGIENTVMNIHCLLQTMAWSGLSFLGKQGKRLAILTAYRSPRQQPMGGFGFYDQQHALLLAKGIKCPNVRKQFVQDIIRFIQSLQHDGYEVMLNLDANGIVDMSTANGICQIMTECSLIDLHSLGPTPPPATYKYGTHRQVDFMLGSTLLSNAIRRSGYLAYDNDNGFFSKHRGLFVDLDFASLMGAVHGIPPAQSRRLQYENPLSVERYLEAFTQYEKDHNIHQRIHDLKAAASSMPVERCTSCYDAIDRDVTRAMLHAEKQSKRTAWSPNLRNAGLVAQYWHLRLKAIERGKNQLISCEIRVRQWL